MNTKIILIAAIAIIIGIVFLLSGVTGDITLDDTDAGTIVQRAVGINSLGMEVPLTPAQGFGLLHNGQDIERIAWGIRGCARSSEFSEIWVELHSLEVYGYINQGGVNKATVSMGLAVPNSGNPPAQWASYADHLAIPVLDAATPASWADGADMIHYPAYIELIPLFMYSTGDILPPGTYQLIIEVVGSLQYKGPSDVLPWKNIDGSQISDLGPYELLWDPDDTSLEVITG